MVENWDDDERSVCKMPYSYKEHCSSDDEYVPVTSIVRDYFREEKERLYTYSTKDDVTWDDDDNIYVEPYSEDSFYEDGNDNTEDGDNTDDCESDYLSGEKEKKKKSITDIIDDDVYKKFSYL